MLRQLRLPICGLASAGAVVYSAKHALDSPSSPSTNCRTLHEWSSSAKDAKRAVVIGAGVAGVSSAYELSRRGYDVIVVESSNGPGNECSAVAAGGMQRSNPVVDRKKWKAILSNVFFGSDFRYFYIDWIHALTDPHFLRWSLDFAYNGLVQPKTLLHQQKEMLKFTNWAIDQFDSDKFLTSVVSKSHVTKRGALILKQTKSSEHCNEEDIQFLDEKEKIYAIEPFVATWQPDVSTALYQPNATSGNSELFTKHLAEKIKKDCGVDFYYNTRVRQLHYDGDCVTRIEFENDTTLELEGKNDQLVIAAGSWTPKLMWQLNEYVPVYPLKGYCIEIPNESQSKIKGIVSDGATYFSRLGNHLRIAAVGEFGGWNTDPKESVDKAFREYVTKTTNIDIQGIPTRCGLRPMSTDGAVITGKLQDWANVSVNTGPGSNGWKIALGAAKVLANSIEDSPTDHLPYDATVLLPQGRVKSTLLWSRLCLLRH